MFEIKIIFKDPSQEALEMKIEDQEEALWIFNSDLDEFGIKEIMIQK